jgi:hypothetical protein
LLSDKQTLKHGEKMPEIVASRFKRIRKGKFLPMGHRIHGSSLLQPSRRPDARLIFMDVSSAGKWLQPALRQPRRILCTAATGALLAAIGCASPGPPRAPTLGLPEPVRDLAVSRIGNTVELHFTVPSRSTDKLPLRGATVTGQLCRQLEHQPCVAVPASRTDVPLTAADTHSLLIWTDILPPGLAQGDPRLLAYRVEFFSHANRSPGPSAPAFTAAGVPPQPVADLQAHGSRLGIVLSWSPTTSPGDVILQREDLAPAAPKAAPKASANPPAHDRKQPSVIEWLGTRPPGDTTAASHTLDTTALHDIPYRYIAERRIILHLDGRPIELRSTAAAVIATLHEIYPPPTPTGVTAVGYFANGTGSSFAVDIIWQPINSAGLIAPLTGYNLYREPLTSAQPTPRQRLNIAPIPSPAFHDTTADPATRYRYSVTAVDTKGNESPAALATLEPSTKP